ncbi:hypothetical protein [Enterococcus durans]|nr:hypothetical protein [Enterococcus durans]
MIAKTAIITFLTIAGLHYQGITFFIQTAFKGTLDVPGQVTLKA